VRRLICPTADFPDAFKASLWVQHLSDEAHTPDDALSEFTVRKVYGLVRPTLHSARQCSRCLLHAAGLMHSFHQRLNDCCCWRAALPGLDVAQQVSAGGSTAGSVRTTVDHPGRWCLQQVYCWV
jgi:hypothetical protein